MAIFNLFNKKKEALSSVSDEELQSFDLHDGFVEEELEDISIEEIFVDAQAAPSPSKMHPELKHGLIALEGSLVSLRDFHKFLKSIAHFTLVIDQADKWTAFLRGIKPVAFSTDANGLLSHPAEIIEINHAGSNEQGSYFILPCDTDLMQLCQEIYDNMPIQYDVKAKLQLMNIVQLAIAETEKAVRQYTQDAEMLVALAND